MARSADGDAPHWRHDLGSPRRETPSPTSRPGAREARRGALPGPRASARPAVDAEFASVYRELRRIAHRHLRRERPGHTLHTTALVNEAYLRLAALEQVIWRDRAHFLAIAARAMRRILIDYAALRRTQKRGGIADTVSIDGDLPGWSPALDDVLAVDAALTRLEQLNPRLVRVVECRFFAGLSIDEAAEALAFAVDGRPRTAGQQVRDWPARFAVQSLARSR